MSRPDGDPYAGRVDADLDLDLDGTALTARLVDIPSVSGGEGPLADAVEAALRPLPHLATSRHGHTIVARTELGRPERVILAGHLDTVPIAGNVPSHVSGSRLFGCGASDMKSGVAVRDLPHGLDPARDVHAVARTASVRRPSVTVIITAVRAAARTMPTQGPQRPQGPQRATEAQGPQGNRGARGARRPLGAGVPARPRSLCWPGEQ